MLIKNQFVPTNIEPATIRNDIDNMASSINSSSVMLGGIKKNTEDLIKVTAINSSEISNLKEINQLILVAANNIGEFGKKSGKGEIKEIRIMMIMMVLSLLISAYSILCIQSN